MVRIHGEAFWLCLPALTDMLIRSESLQRLQALGDVMWLCYEHSAWIASTKYVYPVSAWRVSAS
jgi:hypothetical protein